MEVKEFVKSILKDVTEAVKESNNEKAGFSFIEEHKEGIDFDLAIVSKKSEEGKVGAEILGIGGKVQGNSSNEIVNRIRFRVNTWLK